MSTVGRKRILSASEIKEANTLREEGWTKRQLSQKYEVGETTIWENIFLSGKVRRHPKSKPKPAFRKIGVVIDLIIKMRQNDMTSLEISDILDIPLQEVNYIFSNNTK